MIALVHIEKTGGITLNNVLKKSFGLRHCDVQTIVRRHKEFRKNDFNFAKSLHPQLESIAGHKIRPYVELGDDIQYYTFFRDPIKRCISHYQFQIQKMNRTDKFEDWIKEEHYINYQTKKIAGMADVEKAIEILEERFVFVGLTEKFDESLTLFNQLIQHRLDLNYDKMNVANDNSLRDKIMGNERLLNMVKEANQQDQKLYDYVVGTLYPKMKEKANTLPQPTRNNSGSDYNVRFNRLYRNLIYKPILKTARLLKS